MHSKVPLYAEYHASDEYKYPGKSYVRQHPSIMDMKKTYQCETLLDYGCGKGMQYFKYEYHKKLGTMPDLYDPAVPAFAKLPEKRYDMIYSTDVLEHIPESEIPGVLHWIFLHANKCVFLGIANTPAQAILPNGENAHCTVKPHHWWIDQINRHAHKTIPVRLKTYPAHPQETTWIPPETPVTEFINDLNTTTKTDI